jgi:hypothetical protein
MTSRYVRPDVKAQHHDYEDPDCQFHVGNLSIIWEPLFVWPAFWLSEPNGDFSTTDLSLKGSDAIYRFCAA